MPLDNPRIEELRRRVQADPASIAFAQLAEEYRRSGSYDEAVKTCRLGLARHPGYLSARVTLSRALIELDSLDEAQHELEFVLRAAPENLAAIRGMAEIHHRRGQMPQALEFYRRALEFARHDPELEETVAQIARELGDGPTQAASGLSFEEAQSELLSAFERMPAGPSAPPPIPAVPAVVPPPIPTAAPAAPTAEVPQGESVAETPAAGVVKGESGGDALTDFFADLPDAPPAVVSTSEAPDQPVPSAPGQAGSAPGDQTFDFDSLLEALGEPQDRPAPAPVEALLNASGPDAPAAAVSGSDALALPVEAGGHDPLASLEQSLREYSPPKVEAPEPEPTAASPPPAVADPPAAPAAPAARATAPPAAAPAEESPLSPTQQAIVEDLEQWLEEIVLHRGDSRS